MEYFELTKDMMERAKTYMPLQDKKELAEAIAHYCVRPMKRVRWDGVHVVEMTEEEVKKDPGTLPDLVEEDLALKMCMLQKVLLSWYFGIETEDDDPVTYEQYDHYAGGHLLNQIERFKSDRDVKNKAFDLTEDFREFRKMVDTIIYNYKMNVNDPLKRFDAMLTVFASPANIQAILAGIQQAGDEMEKKVKTAKKQKKGEKVLDSIPEA